MSDEETVRFEEETSMARQQEDPPMSPITRLTSEAPILKREELSVFDSVSSQAISQRRSLPVVETPAQKTVFSSNLWRNQLFKYPEPPPENLMSVAWVQHDYEQLMRQIKKLNEKLLPLLLKKGFKQKPAEVPKVAAPPQQEDYMLQVQQRYRQRKRKSINLEERIQTGLVSMRPATNNAPIMAPLSPQAFRSVVPLTPRLLRPRRQQTHFPGDPQP